MNKEPTERLRRYVENIGRGMDSFSAAKAAGYSDSYARVAAHRLMKKPAVAKAIAAIRAEGMKLASYDLTRAMDEALKAMEFAYKHEQCMAVVKATELRAKLSGLLVDKVEVVSVDLTKALAMAEARVLQSQLPASTQPTTNGALGPEVDPVVAKLSYRGPGTPGDPFTE